MSINRLPDLYQAATADYNHASFPYKSVFSVERDNSFVTTTFIYLSAEKQI